MDDYYRQKAIETRPAMRDLRSVIPNGDDFRSRGYGVHLEARKMPDRPAQMSREYIDAQTIKIACRMCQAQPDQPCISKTNDQACVGFHAQRTSDAARNYRRK